jgi:hypothetical protein
MDEPLHACLFGRGEHGGGPGDIAGLEARSVARVEHAGDVNHRIGAFNQAVEAVGLVERAIDPGNAIARRLGAAGEGLNLMACAKGETEQVPADEPRRAGNR